MATPGGGIGERRLRRRRLQPRDHLGEAGAPRMIPVEHYVVLSALLFVIGGRRLPRPAQRARQLMSIEVMLNAANLALVAFNRVAHRPRSASQAFQGAEPHRPGLRLLHHRRRGGRGRRRPRDRAVPLPPAPHRPVRRRRPAQELTRDPVLHARPGNLTHALSLPRRTTTPSSRSSWGCRCSAPS